MSTNVQVNSDHINIYQDSCESNLNRGTRLITPRSLLAVDSIGSGVISTSPVNYRNIWSSSYKSETTMLSSHDDQEYDYFDESMLIKNFSYLNSPTLSTIEPVDLGSVANYHYVSRSPYPENYNFGVNPNNHPQIKSGDELYCPQPIIYRFTSYTGCQFHVPVNSKFFIIKSYSLLDINASLIHSIWTSTDLGNKRLNQAFQDLHQGGKIFLFFSVNASGKFSGICEMKSKVDFNSTSDIWVEKSRWKGIFNVDWLIIKDVPNKYFHHLKLASNEFKPVTNSRDTQEVPYDIAISMLKIISSFKVME